jgi:prevent-host-death family protein
MNVTVRDFKARLSSYLRKAHAGQDVIITSRGRPVARLLALHDEAGGRPSRQELLERLKLLPGVRLGVGGKPQGARRPLRIRHGQKSLAEMVLEDRG